MLTVNPYSAKVTSCASHSFFFFQAEDGIRDVAVTGVQTCALPISHGLGDRTQIPCRLQGCARPTHFAATSWSSGGGQPWLRKESSLINASRKLQRDRKSVV